METLTQVLEHYGVKGMHWGVRRGRSSKAPPSEDATKANAHMQVVKKSGTRALSNKELSELVTRMNLEAQFSKLKGPGPAAKGKKFAGEVLVGVAKQQAGKALNDVATKQVAAALAKHAAKK